MQERPRALGQNNRILGVGILEPTAVSVDTLLLIKALAAAAAAAAAATFLLGSGISRGC